MAWYFWVVLAIGFINLPCFIIDKSNWLNAVAFGFSMGIFFGELFR
jgi:hypothetical protein